MYDEYLIKAENLIVSATCANGIKALSADVENYGRIWARDSMISGLAGLLSGNEIICKGMENSIITLAQKQHYTGAIPSNVTIDRQDASYGSLAGRVDATTWWLIGLGLLVKKASNNDIIDDQKIKVQKALDVLDAWEFNGRHLIYTPLSGNWADEYPLHGYLLYDNVLRYWALKLWAEIWQSSHLEQKSKHIFDTIALNYWPDNRDVRRYHPKIGYVAEQQFFYAGFHPGGIYKVFDTAGNGLAMLLNLVNQDQKKSVIEYVESVFEQLHKVYLPAFWPVINESDNDYPALANNYAYQFKNRPHHFHNGGIWPVMMGIFAMALTKHGRVDLVEKMQETIYPTMVDERHPFAEYIDSKDFKTGGKKELCFSAAGCIFMAQKNKSHIDHVLNID